jgi:hypothetical protein
MFQARMNAVVRHLAPGVPFGGQRYSRKMSGAETAELILRLVQGRKPKT